MEAFAFVALLLSIPALAIAIVGLRLLMERIHALEEALRVAGPRPGAPGAASECRQDACGMQDGTDPKRSGAREAFSSS